MSAYKSLAGEPGAHNIGTDGPRPKETQGIHLHHACLRIKDPKVSLPFFKDVLGMRTLFTYNAGCFSIYYMFHSDDDVDAEKVWADFPNQKGLLELIHRHGSEDESFTYASGNHPTDPAQQGFGHLGLIVDDVPRLVARAEAAGCKVVKAQGESSSETVGWPKGTPQPIEAYNQLYSNMAMIESPDGTWIELVPRVMDKH
ncbi:uncharacterized protein JCM10292_004497 [Rhodotorula paludigena]|uniref:uncharacterized protein n=1 Tax=Rhodotorula paludigena TaxID=86838 RepID=UPI00317A9434